MSERYPDWQTLNAYVDGALPAAEAAAVARSIVENPRLARETAHLQHLKAVLRASAEPADFALPAPRRRRRLAIAALVALLALGSAVYGWQGRLAEPQVSWPERAVEAHAAWAEQDSGAARPRDDLRLPASLGSFAEAVSVPDLSSAGLIIDHVALVGEAGSREMLHIGYRGTRGCQLSLFVARAGDELPPPGTGFASAGRRFWRVAPFEYALLATGMAPQRFALIAETVEQATTLHLPIPRGERMALARNRAESAPCLG